RFAEARKPPTGEIAPHSGRSTLATTRAMSGPRQPAAITRQIASSSEVAAAVAGVVVAAETAKSGTAAAIATSPPIMRPGRSSRAQEADLLLTLLHRERHQTGDHEQCDERAHTGERSSDRDQPRPARLELR